MKRTLLSLACLLLSATASTAQAAPIIYTTEASWLAALGAATVNTENFGSSPLGDLAAGTTDIGLFNITINAADPLTMIQDSGVVNGTREYLGRLCDLSGFCGLTAMSFGFDSPLIGFAGDWVSTTTGDRLTMLVNGATIKFSDYLTGVGTGFLGVVDSAGFSQITFGLEGVVTASAEVFQLDNARLAAGTANIPEPATLALLGLGLAGLGAMRRRKA